MHPILFVKQIFIRLWKVFVSAIVYPAANVVLFTTSPIRRFRQKRFLSEGASPRSLLVVYLARGLGDCIFFSGVLEGIRNRFPHSKIRLVILTQWEKYFEGNPNINQIIPCPDYFGQGLSGSLRFLRSAIQLRKDGPVDLYLELLPSLMLMPALWSLFVPKRYSVGIGSPLKQLFYDRPVSIKWNQHFFDCLRDGVAPLGIQINQPNFWSPREVSLDGLLDPEVQSMKTIVLAPGGRRNVEAPKDYCWTFEGFDYVMEQLTAEGYRVILTGAEHDLTYLTSIRPNPNLINLVGKTSLAELFTLIKRCARLVVSNNSAPLHIATIFNIPTVSYADPQENMTRWGAYGPDGMHLALQDTGKKKVTPEEFLEAVLKKLRAEEAAYRK